MEQSEREVFELLDLGYGRCRMVLATVAGEPDPAAEALRRLGVMRVATKYPRIAARYFERTGRQAEIVEVKGSVELAPLTGLVEAIVDLTATGTTLRENGLVVREEIAASTARLIANPVAHKLKAAAIDEVAGAAAWRVERFALGDRRPRPRPPRARAGARRARRSPTRWREIVADVRERGDAALRELRRALRRRRRAAARARPTSSRRALDGARPRRARRARGRDRQRRARWPRPGVDDDARGRAARRARRVRAARGARAPRRDLRPRRARARTRRRSSWASSPRARRASTRSSSARPARTR